VENLVQIYPLDERKNFSNTEAEDLIPLLTFICSKTQKQLGQLDARMSYFRGRIDKCQEIQNEMNDVLQLWSEKVRRLGLIPISLNKVRIPSEEGNFVWEYPSKVLERTH